MQETLKFPTMAGIADAAAQSGLSVYCIRALCADVYIFALSAAAAAFLSTLTVWQPI